MKAQHASLWIFAVSLAVLAPAAAQAAGASDYYGRWSRAECADEWFTLAEGKVTSFNKKFAQISPRPTEVPAKITLSGERLTVEAQQKGRKPRRDIYEVEGRDVMVHQDTFVDGRRMPSITRDHVTYKRCK